MEKINFNNELLKTIHQLQKQNLRPKLLLHACCGPCSSYVLEYISSYFDITILYYNPNIYPEQEYNRRLSELEDFLPFFSPALQNKVKLIKAPYIPQDFYNAADIKNHPERAAEPEKGERCYNCYKLRLQYSYDYAAAHNFDYFCTTLSISPFKDSLKINNIGQELAAANPNGPEWLYSDFKKNSGFLRSLELSKEYNLYRQQYCGCVYSKTNTEKAREQSNCSNGKL